MEAIYGKAGVKAGFTAGQCKEDIDAAVDALIADGVNVIVLGCTELPILLPGRIPRPKRWAGDAGRPDRRAGARVYSPCDSGRLIRLLSGSGVDDVAEALFVHLDAKSCSASVDGTRPGRARDERCPEAGAEA